MPQRNMLVELVPGCTLGRYELLMPVARGGMGQLWAAQLRGTRGFQKIVAVKTLLPEALDDPRSEQMFLEEARLASQIHHPNVAEILDLGEEAGTLYLVMEWVHGEPLNRLCQQAASNRGAVPIAVTVNIVGQACRGLHAAHELRDDAGAFLGVVHRDVTPHNLLVTYAGATKLIDFGIAKATAQASSLTQAGEVKGKVAYMAPEQVCSQRIDRRADIFGLGVVLYVATTGEHPFKGENPGETVRNLCTSDAPRRPSEFITNYPLALERAVMKALEKAPEARWPTAQDLFTALAAAVPEAFKEGFEARVAACMNQAFGTLGTERLATLRQRQRLAEQEPPLRTQSGVSFKFVSTAARETGSVRRASVGTTSRQREGTASLHPATVESALGVEQSRERRAPHTRSRQALLVTGILGLSALTMGMLLGYRRVPMEDGVRAAESVVRPAAMRAPPPQESGARPAPAGPIDVAAPLMKMTVPEGFSLLPFEEPLRPAEPPAAAAKSAGNSADRADVQALKRSAHTQGVAPASSSAGSQAAAPAATPAAVSPPVLERPNPKRGDWNANAWNADAFGGRN